MSRLNVVWGSILSCGNCISRSTGNYQLKETWPILDTLQKANFLAGERR